MKISKQISYFCVLTVILIACHRNIEDEFTTVTPDEFIRYLVLTHKKMYMRIYSYSILLAQKNSIM